MTPALASPTDDISSLVRQVSTAQNDLDRLELILGSLREEVNRKLVDLDDAQGAAEQARQGAADAEDELTGSQSELEVAQARLDEIARAAYRQGGGTSAAGLTGDDATQDALDRRTFLRQRADEQQRVVDELDHARTESANSESRARAAAELADARAAAAIAAEEQAQASLAENSAELEKALAERDALIRQRDEAQAELDAQRRVEPAEEPEEAAPAQVIAGDAEGSGVEVDAAVAAVDESPATAAAAMVAASQPEHESLADPYVPLALTDGGEAVGGDDEALVEQPGIAARQAPQVRAAADSAEFTLGEESDAPAAEEPTEVPVEQVADQSETQAPAGGSSTSLVTEVAQFLGAIPATESAATEGQPATGGTSSSLNVGDLQTVLPEIDTAESVTDAAAGLVEPGADARIEAVIARAESQLGTPYAWGGGNAAGPTAGIRDGGTADSHGDYSKVGFDCSGFTLFAFAGAGISLPHYTGYQYQRGEQVDPQDMKRGDLIFYGPGGDQHVAIYLGDGMMIEAPSSGGVVQTTPVRWSGMSPYAVRLI
ncbi:Peptidoglycan endopeptidase RipA precursor [Corynebacterium guangdongense]|nr:Peptidoglycan endopeptidase RipA precursor [Corynebacterium guangdongense]